MSKRDPLAITGSDPLAITGSRCPYTRIFVTRHAYAVGFAYAVCFDGRVLGLRSRSCAHRSRSHSSVDLVLGRPPSPGGSSKKWGGPNPTAVPRKRRSREAVNQLYKSLVGGPLISRTWGHRSGERGPEGGTPRVETNGPRQGGNGAVVLPRRGSETDDTVALGPKSVIFQKCPSVYGLASDPNIHSIQHHRELRMFG